MLPIHFKVQQQLMTITIPKRTSLTLNSLTLNSLLNSLTLNNLLNSLLNSLMPSNLLNSLMPSNLPQQPYAQQPYAQQPYAQQPPQQPYAYNSYPSPYGGYYGYGYGGGIYNDPMLWNDPLSIGIIQMLTTSCRLLSESPDIINQTKENIRAYVNIASGLYSGQVIDTNLIEKVATKTIKTCQNNPDLLYGKALYLSLTSSGVSIKSLLNLDIFSKNNSNNSNNSINSNKTYSSNPNSTQKSQDSHSTTDTGTYTYPNSTGTPSDYSPNNGGTYYTNPNKGKY